MLNEFDQEVGLHYLKAIHLNDSKGPDTDKQMMFCALGTFWNFLFGNLLIIIKLRAFFLHING